MLLAKNIRILAAGDRALVIELGDEISPEINHRVRATVAALKKRPVVGMEELVPSYRSILLYYNPLVSDFRRLEREIWDVLGNLVVGRSIEEKTIVIPVCYGGEYGPDLDEVARLVGLSRAEVIKIHSSSSYYVYMLGFTPGFPYLGGLNPRLFVSRLESPRGKIPAGSVGLAGKQTGVYPIESPGGWRLIGRTPLRLFDPLREPPVLINAGNYVRFQPISAAGYEELLQGPGSH
jgi:inhibitor of KinA